MSQPVVTMLKQIEVEEISMNLPPDSIGEQRNSADTNENEIEIEIDQVDLKYGGQTASENVSNTKISKCMRKCLRMGSRICFSDMTGEDNIVGESFEAAKTTESVHSGQSQSPSADSVHSGESLFKTFTFNPEENSAEMKKCMAFWKSVLESNLKPMNFTIVESPPKTKPKKKLSEKHKCDCKEMAEKHMQETWKKAWKEIQKRRLNEIKLSNSRKEQRKMCDIDELEETDKADEAATIKALNEWKPKSKGPIRKRSDIVKSKAKELADKEMEKIRSRSTQNLRQSVHKLSIVQSVMGKSTTAISNNSQLMKEGSKKVLTSVAERINTDSIIAVFFEPQSQSKPEQISRNEDDPDGCACGCSLEDCICEELGDDIDLLYVSSKTRTNCSCDCGLEQCICREIEALGVPNGRDYTEAESSNIQSNLPLCHCGCGIRGCICQMGKSAPTATPADTATLCAPPPAVATNISPNFKTELEENIYCKCGCDISGCICKSVDTNGKRRSEPERKCPCGCGILGCRCIDLLGPGLSGDACLCGATECTCGGDELSPKSHTQCNTCQQSVGVQYGKSVVRLTVPEKPGFYCAICGHFDCCCRNMP